MMMSRLLLGFLWFHGCFLISAVLADLQPEASRIPNPHSVSYPFLKDVLKFISSKHGWKEDQVRVLKLDVETPIFGNFCNFEFRIRMKKSRFALKFSRKQERWKRYITREADFGLLIRKLIRLSMLENFRVEGPVELNVISSRDELSISLPMNSSYTGLRRVVVGEGITLEVRNAREVFLLQQSDLGFHTTSRTIPFWNPVCFGLPSVRIAGSASLLAYKNQSPDERVTIKHRLKKETIELLPDKCYTKPSSCHIDIFKSQVGIIKRVMTDVEDRFQLKGMMNIIKAGVRASTVARFRMAVERVVEEDDMHHWEEWRTRPGVERSWFEVVAVLEEAIMKPMQVMKVDDIEVVDTHEWSKVLRNVSFTQLLPSLVSSSALTLGVK